MEEKKTTVNEVFKGINDAAKMLDALGKANTEVSLLVIGDVELNGKTTGANIAVGKPIDIIASVLAAMNRDDKFKTIIKIAAEVFDALPNTND